MTSLTALIFRYHRPSKFWNFACGLAWLATVAPLVASDSGPPERRVDGSAVVSERDPAVRIAPPKSAQYLGADRFVLYEIADCELHVFVEADNQKTIERLYWVQFESYLPSRPELHHTYDSPRHASIGGLDFYVDTWMAAKSSKATPGSDREHVKSLVQAKGYRMPAEMMVVRLVHLMDEKRKELMIIYAEDLGRTGFKAAELEKGGAAHDRWPVLERGLIESAEKKIAIERLAPR